MLTFDKSTQVVSALGAIIALIVLTLIGITGFFFYAVYFKG